MNQVGVAIDLVRQLACNTGRAQKVAQEVADAGPHTFEGRHHVPSTGRKVGRSPPRPVPTLRFSFQLPAPGRGEPVGLGPSVRPRRSPLGLQPTPLLEPVQRRKERARIDLKRPLRELLHAPRHPEAVVRVERQRLQDQQVERAPEQISSRQPALPLGSTYRSPIGNTPETYRTSIGREDLRRIGLFTRAGLYRYRRARHRREQARVIVPA